jgi:hypothetical protein
MAAKGLQQYTEKESGNASLGQGGSVLIDTIDANCTAPANKVFIAIQVLDAVQFTATTGLIAENPALHMNTAQSTGLTTDYAIDASNTFPVGTIIYGRWTSINLAAGTCIAYLGG